MNDRREIALDEALRALAVEVAFPDTPDLAGQLERRLVAGSERHGPPGWRWTRAIVLAAALTVLVAASALALAWVLPGLRIVPVSSVPAVPSAPLGSGLGLGDRVDRVADVPFVIGALGTPDDAYAAEDGDVVTLVYRARDDLPALGDGVGLLAQRIAGELDRARVMKLVDEIGARVVPVTVDGAAGFWVAGPPHLVRYLGPDGEERVEMTRLAGDTLVWQDGTVLYRLESPLGLEATVRLAESLEEEGTAAGSVAYPIHTPPIRIQGGRLRCPRAAASRSQPLASPSWPSWPARCPRATTPRSTTPPASRSRRRPARSASCASSSCSTA